MSSIIVEKSRVEERLTELEKDIRERAEAYDKIEITLEEAGKGLRQVVEEYQSTREKAQREVWAEKGLGWCQSCDKFYPRRNIRLLYTVGKEWSGSEYTQSYSLYRRLRSYCQRCAEKILSQPRGGDSEFQCYKARQAKEGFERFISGSWEPLDLSEPYPQVIIDIERGYIPGNEYIFGKAIRFDGWPSMLKIGAETIVRIH